jgi:AcrR family transcriptional regulator
LASPVRRVPPRVRVRTRDPEAKRARVLAAARTLFAERGYAATTTADVARRASVSEGIVFHHYGSKEGLLAAVSADYGRALGAAMFAGAVEADPDGPPGAEPMLRRAFAFVREQGVLARLLVLSGDASVRQTVHQASRTEIVAAIESALRDPRGREAIRPMDATIAARLLFALVEEALTQCFVRENGEREEEYLREAVRCVEGAVLRRDDPRPSPKAR